MVTQTSTASTAGVDDDDQPWETRSAMWASRIARNGASRAKHQRSRKPLVLSGHGISLRIEGTSLLIRNGFTHYPQKEETYRFFKGEFSIPERVIILDGDGSISFDVLSWLAEQDVSLVRIDWQGEVVCVASRSGYSANPFRVQWQRETRSDKIRRMEFSISIITKKIENSISTMDKSARRNEAWNKAMEMAYATLTKLDAGQANTIAELRAMEANAAAAYFRAWKGMPIRWRSTTRRPIPDSWKTIEQRSSPYQLSGNRNAAHPVNAILNYAYAVLQSQTQIDVVAEGYDPTMGIMHEARDGSAAFVFDLMEPERPLVDQKVLEFVNRNVFDPADFVIRSDGVCRLNPEMARCAVGIVSDSRVRQCGLISD